MKFACLMLALGLTYHTEVGGSLLTTHVNSTNQPVGAKSTAALPSARHTMTPNSLVTIPSVTKTTTDKAAQATKIPLAASMVADPTASVVEDPGTAGPTGAGAAGPAVPGATRPADPAAAGPAIPGATRPADPAAIGPADPAAIGPADPAAIGPADPAAIGPADPAAIGPADPAAIGPADPAAVGPADPAAIGTADPATVGPAVPSAAGPADPGTTGPADPATVGPAVASAAGPADPGTTGPADLSATGTADPGVTVPATAVAIQADPTSNTKDPQSSLVPPTGAPTSGPAKFHGRVAGSSYLATTPQGSPVTTRTLARHTTATLQAHAHTEESTTSLRQTTETRTLRPAERTGPPIGTPTGAPVPTTASAVEAFNSNSNSNSKPQKYWYSLNNGHQEEEDKDLMEVCRRLMAHLKEGNCTLTWRHHQGKLIFDCVEINGKVKTALATQYYEDISKKATDNKTLIAILASCGALLIMIIILAVCASHHRKPYSPQQQHLTEELPTMENGYHDNPTLEVMEVQPEMQEKKVAMNGDFGDSWIVPMDNLLKEDLPDEEDTHL
ncbi:podocalyxin [Nerophis ophidion]|uniref:podocalyxin n=1 Tax=Nerophis ophidion TaxID=159077 RepID=UPI002ADFFB40|nr:podocalyxin [Nerophis ophidion]